MDTPRDIQNAEPPNLTLVLPNANELSPDKAKRLGVDCYESSTDWINSSRRSKWADSLRAFQGQHPSGSKYLSSDYRYRSRLFRPKTRAMVRNAEAETAEAFFANEDVVNISAQNDNDPMQQASAALLKRLLQYRLTKTIPWFLTIVGARQDAEVMGICIGKAYWKYSERTVDTQFRPSFDQETGEISLEAYDITEKEADHPWIDLLAAENFRFDPASDWRNPVATSPYLIELIPMYIMDARAKIDSGEWLPVPESALYAATNMDDDTTRRARESDRTPGKDTKGRQPRDFDICWIRENIIRFNGKDWHFYSLSGSGQLLTNPRPLSEVYLHGIRPYTVGFVVPEAHKTHPMSKVEMVRDLQTKANDVDNLRLDNVKLALNPRQFLAAGSGADVNDVRVFNPGKVVVLKQPRESIVWDRPPEVTAASYQEQDRINLDFEELVGGMSNSSIQANRQIYEAVGNMEMMQDNGSKLGSYDQRVFAETFVEPLVRQLVLLEQEYETDAVILALAGQEAQLFQKFGMNQITDHLLKQELTTKVNVGIGATNPKNKLNAFATAAQVLGTIFGPAAAMGANFEEVVKEVFSLSGYRDGQRFFKPGFDPSQVGQPGDDGTATALAEAEKMRHQADMQEIMFKHKHDMEKLNHQTELKIGEIKTKALTEIEKTRMQLMMQQGEHMREQAIALKEKESKPQTMVQFDANDAIQGVAANIQGMAEGTMQMIQQILALNANSTAAIAQILNDNRKTDDEQSEALKQLLIGLTAAINEQNRINMLEDEAIVDPVTKRITGRRKKGL